MKNIRLGLDIGTQFCYAGYCVQDDEFKFNVAFDTVNFSPLGIPSEIAVSKNDPSRIFVGNEAIDQKINNQAYELTRPLKELIRDHPERRYDLKPFVGQTGGRGYSIGELLTPLIEYLYRRISEKLSSDSNLSDGYRIVEVDFACPNLIPNQNDEFSMYIQNITEILKSTFREHNPEINVQLEGSLCGVLVKDLVNINELNEYSYIFTIDIGAGTTDFSLFDCKGHVMPLHSVKFGGKNIDENLTKAARATNVITPTFVESLNHNPESKCNFKKFLFNSGDYGSYTIPEELMVNKATYTDTLIECIKNDRPYHVFIDILKKDFNNIKPYVNKTNNFLIVLFGGTSRISFIKDEIESEFKNILGFPPTIKYLYQTSNANSLGVNDANYIAFAAIYNKKNVESREIHLESREIKIGAPCIYAIKSKNESDNIERYNIIASPNANKCGADYFLTKNVFWQVNGNRNRTEYFNASSHLYAIYTYDLIPTDLKSLKQKGNTEKYSCNDTDEIINVERIEPLNDYVGFKGQLPDNETINRRIGTIYDYSSSVSVNKRLHIIFYNSNEDHKNSNEDHKAFFGDIPKIYQLSYEDMLKKISESNENIIAVEDAKPKKKKPHLFEWFKKKN